MLVNTPMAQREQWILQEMNRVKMTLLRLSGQCAQRYEAGGDIVDHASRTVALGTERALHQVYQNQLKQLERFWDRVCLGQYGICELCGAQIEPARMDVLPYTTLCVCCQRQIERQGPPQG